MFEISISDLVELAMDFDSLLFPFLDLVELAYGFLFFVISISGFD